MTKIKIIWIIISSIFILLFIYHIYLSTQKINKINIMQIPEKLPYFVGEDWPDDFDLLDPIKIFINDFNNQIDKQNKLHQKINACTALGYLAAIVASILAVHQINKELNLLKLKNNQKKRRTKH